MTYDIKPLRWRQWSRSKPYTVYANTVHGTFYIEVYDSACSIEMPTLSPYKQFAQKRTVEQAKRYCQRVHDREVKKWLRRKA